MLLGLFFLFELDILFNWNDSFTCVWTYIYKTLWAKLQEKKVWKNSKKKRIDTLINLLIGIWIVTSLFSIWQEICLSNIIKSYKLWKKKYFT